MCFSVCCPCLSLGLNPVLLTEELKRNPLHFVTSALSEMRLISALQLQQHRLQTCMKVILRKHFAASPTKSFSLELCCGKFQSMVSPASAKKSSCCCILSPNGLNTGFIDKLGTTHSSFLCDAMRFMCFRFKLIALGAVLCSDSYFTRMSSCLSKWFALF